MVSMRPMEQRRGREFIREFIIVGFCENVVANGLSDSGWTFGTDLDIGTDLFIGTGWICGTDLVIDTDPIIGTDSFIYCAYGFIDLRVVIFV